MVAHVARTGEKNLGSKMKTGKFFIFFFFAKRDPSRSKRSNYYEKGGRIKKLWTKCYERSIELLRRRIWKLQLKNGAESARVSGQKKKGSSRRSIDAVSTSQFPGTDEYAVSTFSGGGGSLGCGAEKLCVQRGRPAPHKTGFSKFRVDLVGKKREKLALLDW